MPLRRPDTPAPPLPEHWPLPRDEWHEEWGITYCARCGRVLVKDKDPDFVQKKDCQVVKVSLRG